jgi:parvulin-like peptidyl-prolyl isomerase
MVQKIWRVIAFVCLSAILAACGASPAPVATSAPQVVIPPVVARVNGTEISREAFQAVLSRLTPSENPDPVLVESVLNAMIEQTLIEQAAVNLGVAVTDDDLDAEIAALQELTTDWPAWLSENGYTEDELRVAVRSNLVVQRVRDAVLAEEGTPETLRAVRARHILVDSETDALSVRERLQNGEEFGALARELSRDQTTRESGGDLGFFIREDLITPELYDLAAVLEPGQMAGPIQTTLGWHMIQTLEVEDRAVTPDLEASVQEARFTAWLSEQRSAATIERF